MSSVNIMWFRRDLRLSDNTALYHALQSGLPVIPVFIFDKNILDDLEDKSDKRVAFIHSLLKGIDKQLRNLGSGLTVHYDTPENAFKALLTQYEVVSVFANHDYEPYAKKRDEAIKLILSNAGAGMQTFKDQVVFEKEEVLKDDGRPYTVFTPYSRKWKSILLPKNYAPYPTEALFDAFYQYEPDAIPSMAQIGFKEMDGPFPSHQLDEALVKKYKEQRDFPAIPGTSKLGLHLRFGSISIRQLVSRSILLSESFLNELIWRDFYHMILWHFPYIGEGKAFRKEYDLIAWRNNTSEFEKWCKGITGYPIVDAGMRELNATGFMHNRVRMVVASFLTKHLLIDWRWGEAYFAKKLLDFDFAANNGGWQWAAGSGCDAAPYFRIFNPALQAKKFDPQLQYIRKWVPEIDSLQYPAPMVNHEMARKRCLETYAAILKK